MSFAIRAATFELGERQMSVTHDLPEFASITTKTGIDQLFETSRTSLDLALGALKKLFGSSDLQPSHVDCLILVTQSPVDFLPSGACSLQSAAGLRTDVLCFDVSQGCSGFVQALTLASRLVGQFENIVVVCSDTYRSKLDRSDRSTAPIFSDTASATWITSERCLEIVGESHFSDGHGRNFLFHKVSVGGEPEFLHMSGPDVLLFAKRVVPNEVRTALKRAGVDRDEIDNWFFHQASKLVLDALETSLGLSDIVCRNLSDVGNTVSSAIPILMSSRVEEINQRTSVFCGFGVGLSVATVVTRPIARH